VPPSLNTPAVCLFRITALLGGLQPQALRSEPAEGLAALEAMLLELLETASCECTGPQSYPQVTARLLAAAVSALLALVLGRGDAASIVRLAHALLQLEGGGPVAVPVPAIAVAVERSVRSMLGLPPGLVYPTAFDSAQAYRLTATAAQGPDAVASLASDGTYLYLLRPSRLQVMRIGRGSAAD
jgi:hypothetical protein